MGYENLINLAKDMQGVALVSHNYNFVKKKKKKAKDFVDVGVTNIVGSNLMRSY